MRRTTDQILADALELPEEARARLAQSLITSLDVSEAEDPQALERSWVAEASRRASELDKAAVDPIPAIEAFRNAREELQGLRARRRHGD
jgi:hypothetical protein